MVSTEQTNSKKAVEVYECCDIVQNFSLLDISCANPGNPVFTCDKRTVDKAKVYTFDPKERKETFYRHQHPMYSTTSGIYGSLKSDLTSTPTTFHGKSQHFSEHLAAGGMYRNHSLNTAPDHSRV